jgi:hypothetical protein
MALDPTPLSDLLAAADRDALPGDWTGGEAAVGDGQLTRRFAARDGERVVFYALDADGTATLARARWDDDAGEYVVGPDRTERADAATDVALFRAALDLMATWPGDG